MFLGVHYIVELYGIPKEFLQSEEKLRQVIGDGIVIGNLHPVGDVYYKFHESGVSGVVLLKESHLSFHTWDEYGYMALDVFSCGEYSNPLETIKYIAGELGGEIKYIDNLNRGYINKVGGI